MQHPSNMVGTQPAVVTEDVTSYFKPLLIDANTQRTVTFYVNSVADGGFNAVHGPYTLKITCDYTVLVKQDAGFVTSYTVNLVEANAKESITFTHFTAHYPSSPAYAAPLNQTPTEIMRMIPAPPKLEF